MREDIRKPAAAVLIAAAVATQYYEQAPEPAPPPTPGGLVLKFQGPTASQDARIVEHLTAEIADVIELDGKCEKPRMSAGVHFDDLRTQAREFRCRGERIGERQPEVNAAVHKYLDDQLGESGGPVTPEQRQKWIDAYREISKAARVAK